MITIPEIRKDHQITLMCILFGHAFEQRDMIFGYTTKKGHRFMVCRRCELVKVIGEKHGKK